MPNATALPGKKTLSFLENSMAAQKWHLSSLKFKFLSIWVPFPANPSQIPPTLCHGNKVKPWKSLENYQIYRSFDETEKERKKIAVFGRNSQKFTKSAKENRKKVFQPKIFKFYRGRWTPWSNAPVWAPTSHALADLAKKSQKVPNEKISQKKIFFKFQKRS